MRFTVQAPDGRKVTLEGNHIPTEQELNQVFGSVGENNKQNKSYALGRLGTIDRGVTFGLGRKLGGVINAIGAYPVDRAAQLMGVKNTPSFMDRYHEIVDPTIKAIEQYHEDKPVEATALELGAGFANPANRLGVGYIAKGGSLANKAARAAGVGAGVGGVAGGLNAERVEDVAPNAVGGSVGGAVIGGALPLAAGGIGKVVNAVRNARNPQAMTSLSQIVEAESLNNAINEAQRTGRSILEVGDDSILQAAQKVRQQTPEARQILSQRMQAIAEAQPARTEGVINEALGSQGKNASIRQVAEAARKKAQPMYKELENIGDLAKYETRDLPEQNFKRWFEGSQVVDENGQPLKLYHGTDADFDAFDMSKGRSTMDIQGAFFSPYDIDAKGYGRNLKEVYLNIKNPADEATAYKALRKYQGQNDAGLKARQDLQRQGFDGVFNGYDEYIAFEPNQIKSVNNSGAWSSSPSLSDAGWKAEPSIKDIKLNQYQQNAMNKALAEGASMSDYPLGSLDATHKAQGVLNDMINASYDSSNPLKPRATTETSQLMSLKKVFNELMELSGVKPLDARISKAKTLRSNFEKGYNFRPSETKFDNLGLNTARDKKAFLQGRLAKLQDNVLSEGGTNLADAIIKDQNTLKKLMPKKQFDSLMNTAGSLKESFSRLKSIEEQANRELLRDIERGGSPWRENIESKGSLIGRALDVTSNALNKGSRRRLAEAYLNPEISEIRQFGGVKGALKGASSASLRQALVGNKEK